MTHLWRLYVTCMYNDARTCTSYDHSTCNMTTVHACTMIEVHACTMIAVHVCKMMIGRVHSSFSTNLRARGPGSEAPRISRVVWGAPGPPTFAQLPILRMYLVKVGCPALQFAPLPDSIYSILAQFSARGQVGVVIVAPLASTEYVLRIRRSCAVIFVAMLRKQGTC